MGTPVPTLAPTPSPTPTPLPTPAPTGDCVPIGDCGSQAWCDQEAFVAWCGGHSVDQCHDVFCRVNGEAPGPCADSPLPEPWGGGGSHNCATYSNHGGTDYCAHQAIKDNCCFCKNSLVQAMPVRRKRA